MLLKSNKKQIKNTNNQINPLNKLVLKINNIIYFKYFFDKMEEDDDYDILFKIVLIGD